MPHRLDSDNMGNLADALFGRPQAEEEKAKRIGPLKSSPQGAFPVLRNQELAVNHLQLRTWG
jgi:hypothetical protein